MLLHTLLAPRASRNSVLGVHDGKLKVAITAPPVDGKANEALCKYLAKLLGVPRSSVSIERGHTSREKWVALAGTSRAALTARLDEVMNDA